MTDPVIRRAMDALPRQPAQDQRALNDQLRDLCSFASAAGMYDAADFIARAIAPADTPTPALRK